MSDAASQSKPLPPLYKANSRHSRPPSSPLSRPREKEREPEGRVDMVKFSRELEAQLIPEWKEAFVNYKHLKKHIKKIKLSLLRRPSSTTPDLDDIPSPASDRAYGFSLLDPVRSLASHLHHRRHAAQQVRAIQDVSSC